MECNYQPYHNKLFHYSHEPSNSSDSATKYFIYCAGWKLTKLFLLERSNMLCSLKIVLVILRCKSPFFGSSPFLWPSTGHDLSLSKLFVAADYPDSIPDSSSDMSHQGYHPLEELKVSNDSQPARLSPAVIAKTTIEVCIYMLLCIWNWFVCNIYLGLQT